MAELEEIETTGGGSKDPLSWLVQESETVINEEGEDDEDSDGEEDEDSGDDDSGEEDEDSGDDGGDSSDSDSEEGDKPEEEPAKPFDNIELNEAFCFGWCPKSAGEAWANIADASITKGWKNSDVRRLDEDLKKNVDACYFFVCQGTFNDLDTGYVWRAAFVNDHMLWKLQLGNSGAEVMPEDAKAFFSCEYFKKFAKRCGDLIDRANKIYANVVDQHLKNGELMAVDPIKLDRIVHDSTISRFMDNLRKTKYELQ